MSAPTIVLNATFPEEMLARGPLRGALMDIADRIAITAAATAPRGFMGERSRYGAIASELGAYVIAGPGWHLIEWGTRYHPPWHVLQNAIAQEMSPA